MIQGGSAHGMMLIPALLFWVEKTIYYFTALIFALYLKTELFFTLQVKISSIMTAKITNATPIELDLGESAERLINYLLNG